MIIVPKRNKMQYLGMVFLTVMSLAFCEMALAQQRDAALQYDEPQEESKEQSPYARPQSNAWRLDGTWVRESMAEMHQEPLVQPEPNENVSLKMPKHRVKVYCEFQNHRLDKKWDKGTSFKLSTYGPTAYAYLLEPTPGQKAYLLEPITKMALEQACRKEIVAKYRDRAPKDLKDLRINLKVSRDYFLFSSRTIYPTRESTACHSTPSIEQFSEQHMALIKPILARANQLHMAELGNLARNGGGLLELERLEQIRQNAIAELGFGEPNTIPQSAFTNPDHGIYSTSSQILHTYLLRLKDEQKRLNQGTLHELQSKLKQIALLRNQLTQQQEKSKRELAQFTAKRPRISWSQPILKLKKALIFRKNAGVYKEQIKAGKKQLKQIEKHLTALQEQFAKTQALAKREESKTVELIQELARSQRQELPANNGLIDQQVHLPQLEPQPLSSRILRASIPILQIAAIAALCIL